VPSPRNLEANVLAVQCKSAARRVCIGSASDAEMLDIDTACQHDEDTPAGLRIMKTTTQKH